MVRKPSRIVLLREDPSAATRLRSFGVEVGTSAMIRTVPRNGVLLNLDLSAYSDFVFTSRRAVVYFLEQVGPMSLMGRKVWAVGPKTAAGLPCKSIVPKRYCQEGLLEKMDGALFNRRFFWPRAEKARLYLQDVLEARGAILDSVILYETEILHPPLILSPGDGVIFTSPSQAEAFFSHPQWQNQDIAAFCIGEQTAKAVAKHRGPTLHLAFPSHMDRLVEMVAEYWRSFYALPS